MSNIDERLRRAGEGLANETDPSGAFDRIATGQESAARRGRPGGATAALVVVVIAGVAAGSYGLLQVFAGTGNVAAGRLTQSHRSSPRALALAEAGRVVRLVRVPPGSVEASSSPVGDLDQPGEEEGSRFLVDVPRWWQVPMTVEDAASWIRAHPPRGLHDAGISGSGSGPGGPNEIVVYAGTGTWAYEAATLVIYVVPDGAGSAIRADGQAIYIPVRPAVENVPLDVAWIDLAAVDGRTGKRTLTSVSGVEARRLGRLLNGLRIDGGIRSCPAEVGSSITAKVRTDHGTLVFTEGECFSVSVALDGRKLPILEDSFALQRALDTALGLPRSP